MAIQRVFVDVDVQHDFCEPSGALYVKGSPNDLYRALTRHAAEHRIPILGSVDSHAWDAWEFASSETRGPSGEKPNFPDHCVKGTHGWLKVARNVGGAWTTSVVDAFTNGVTYTSLAFDAQNQPAISYYDIDRADLKFSHFITGVWSSQRIASKGAQGLYTQLYFTADGLANIIYYNRKNDVVIKVTGDIPNWTPSELQTGGGRYLALATNPLDGVASYTWFQPGVAKLRVADIV